MRTCGDNNIIGCHLCAVHFDYFLIHKLCFTFYIGDAWHRHQTLYAFTKLSDNIVLTLLYASEINTAATHARQQRVTIQVSIVSKALRRYTALVQTRTSWISFLDDGNLEAIFCRMHGCMIASRSSTDYN